MRMRSRRRKRRAALLLSDDTKSSTSSASGLGVLSSDTETPVVTETSVSLDLLETLEVLTEFGIKVVRGKLVGLSVLEVALTIEEPLWDAMAQWVEDDLLDLVHLVLIELTSSTLLRTRKSL
eukprot:TRINITY_DN2811_c0_g1_i1.p1 TRINITY_DN2811_c0_g1~~TRINITY_DN2811_c0_g1_i1.p1  ORF type:complete len:122 (+),score=18.20 TRINITY_DN2811_c0_g1_i1:84-449(+)